jgi:hypothetical protein
MTMVVSPSISVTFTRKTTLRFETSSSSASLSPSEKPPLKVPVPFPPASENVPRPICALPFVMRTSMSPRTPESPRACSVEGSIWNCAPDTSMCTTAALSMIGSGETLIAPEERLAPIAFQPSALEGQSPGAVK